MTRTLSGLHDPSFERDACGVGFVADIKGTKSRSIIDDGLEVLRRLSHRAACGADPETGDGAGILIQLPDRFLRAEIARGVTGQLFRALLLDLVATHPASAADALGDATADQLSAVPQDVLFAWLQHPSASLRQAVVLALPRWSPADAPTLPALDRAVAPSLHRRVMRGLAEHKVREVSW